MGKHRVHNSLEQEDKSSHGVNRVRGEEGDV